MTADLTVDTFRSLLGTTLVATHGDTSLDLLLAEVKPLGEGRDGGRTPFALMFRGPTEPMLPQGTYPLSGDALAEDIFLVPVGRTDEGVDYEAIFT